MGLFLYPLPQQYANIFDGANFQGAKTYSTHGVGKLDLACPPGTEVRSMTDGVVVRAGCDTNGAYQSVQVKVTNPAYKMPPNQDYFIIRYYHVGNMQVSEGDYVKQGDLLATTGEDLSTARVSDHLHLDFALSVMPVLWGSTLSDNQLNADQTEAYNIWNAQSGGNNYKGRCWEVLGTRGKLLQATTDTINTPKDTVFIKDISRGTFYGNYPSGASTQGGSGRILIDCSKGMEYEQMQIKGSIACRVAVLGQNDNGAGYGYNYNGKRTICYIEVAEHDEMNGYYFLDDSNATSDINPYDMIDFYYVSYDNVPGWFKSAGVIKNSIKLYIVNY